MKLTAGLRAYHENVDDSELVQQAVAAKATRLSIKAGIPGVSVPTVAGLNSRLQSLATEAGVRRIVVRRKLDPSNDKN